MLRVVEFCPVVFEKMLKIWKVYRQTEGQTDGQADRHTDDGQNVIRIAHYGAKNGVKKLYWERLYARMENA